MFVVFLMTPTVQTLHTVFDNEMSKRIVQRFKPPFNGLHSTIDSHVIDFRKNVPQNSNIFIDRSKFNTDFKKYIQSRISLEDERVMCICASNTHLSVFICKFETDKTILYDTFWPDDYSKRSESFQELEKWHYKMVPYKQLVV
jgi:hypothetical protein